MVRLIFFILLILILYYLLRFLFKDRVSSGEKMNIKNEPDELVQDPCCQTYIPKRSALKKKIAGEVLYFCNQECLKNYVQKVTKSG